MIEKKITTSSTKPNYKYIIKVKVNDQRNFLIKEDRN